MLAPPFGATEKALPGTASVWSRFSDQVTVTVVPSEATVAELIVGAVVSTRKERIALKEELAADESTFFARQEEPTPKVRWLLDVACGLPVELMELLGVVES